MQSSSEVERLLSHDFFTGITPEQRQSATLTAVGTRLLMFGGRQVPAIQPRVTAAVAYMIASRSSVGQGELTFMNDTWVFDTLSCQWTCALESEA